MNKYTPNGLSIAQLKKDAKKLSKKSSVPLSKSLDLIATSKTNSSSWSKLIQTCNSLDGSIHCFRVKSLANKSNLRFSVFKSKPLLLVTGEIGTGKTLLAHRLLSSDIVQTGELIVCDFGSVFNSGLMESYVDVKRHYVGRLSLIPYEDFLGSTYMNRDGRWVINYLLAILGKLSLGKASVLYIDELCRLECGIHKLESHLIIEAILEMCVSKGIVVIAVGQVVSGELNVIMSKYASALMSHDGSVSCSMVTGSFFDFSNLVSGESSRFKLVHSDT
ncbi:hypothetical protein VCHA53O466_40315 [Vibrio chagasii]|nr:hypothetical protein VCHA53O466_40315 [Vibrio chagasii]